MSATVTAQQNPSGDVAGTVSILDAVRALAPECRDRAGEGEALRTMPADLAARLGAAGVFGMSLPQRLGGLELDPLTQMRAVEELSHADGSAGWTVMIGASGGIPFAWLDPGVAAAMLAEGRGPAASLMIGPLGRAVPDGPGGSVVDGRWPFNSGCLHAGWHGVGVLVTDGSAPRALPGGAPDWRVALVRPADAAVVDTWDALGLRGTGSHDLTVTGVRVPDEHVAAPFFEPARHNGPLWMIPFFTQIAVTHAGFALGVGRRALDEFTTLAVAKKRGAAPEPVAAAGDAQLALAHAEGALHAARSFVVDAVGDAWDTACAGDLPDLDQRARVLLAALNAQRAAVAAVDAVFPFAGAGAVYASRPLQRCYRDLHTSGQHIFVSADAWKRYAKLRLGVDQQTFQI